MIKLGKLKLGGSFASTAVPVEPVHTESNNSPAPATNDPEPEVDRPAVDSTPAPAVKIAGIKLGGLRLGTSVARVSDSSKLVDAVALDSQLTAAMVSSPPVVDEHTPEGFQAKLDKLDSLIVAGAGAISPLSLDSARSYVKEIFIELKAYPEFDAIFIDRDMHNVMTFMQQTTTQAKVVISDKKTSAETRAINKAKKTANTSFGDFSSFGDPAKAITNQVATAAAVGSALDAFGSLNVDEIASKTRR